MKMLKREVDPKNQVLLTRHIDDETRHARLWTERIQREGRLPVAVDDGYQRRLGRALGLPHTMEDLYALTVVVEERAQLRYIEHARSAHVDADTLEVLGAVTDDETWHIAWMRGRFLDAARERGEEEAAIDQLRRYREIEETVFAELISLEQEWMGFSFSHKLAAAA